MGMTLGTAGGSCDHQSEQPIGSLRRGWNKLFRGGQKVTQEKEKLTNQIAQLCDKPIFSYPITFSNDDQFCPFVHDQITIL